MFGLATQAEIIRSNQKDEYYLSYIRGSLANAVQTFFGPRNWISWRKELDVVADLGYFALTTLAGYQTLGEEYVNIVQVDSTQRAVPSPLHRLSLVCLHVLSPYLLDRLLAWAERQLQSNPDLALTPSARSRLLELIPALRHVVMLLHRCHLAAFYLRGAFYHLAKRFTAVRYILVRSGMSDEARPSYRILGWLSLIQLLLTFTMQTYKVIRSKSRSSGGQPSQANPDPVQKAGSSEGDAGIMTTATKCSLCLEARSHSTATPCGHLFCWACITEWCATKPECPLCREKFEMSRLIFLQNYDPVGLKID